MSTEQAGGKDTDVSSVWNRSEHPDMKASGLWIPARRAEAHSRPQSRSCLEMEEVCLL